MDEAVSLVDHWRALDDQILAKNPISLRLPVHMVARLAALGEMFPTRNRSQLLIDLLSKGFHTFEESFPEEKPKTKEANDVIMYAMGETYRQSTNKHYQKLAKEVGAINPPPLFTEGR